MTITEMRSMLDLIKKFTEEDPIEIKISQEEVEKVKQAQAILKKQEVQDTFKKLAFFNPDNQQ